MKHSRADVHTCWTGTAAAPAFMPNTFVPCSSERLAFCAVVSDLIHGVGCAE
jgi:hypothetical protein